MCDCVSVRTHGQRAAFATPADALIKHERETKIKNFKNSKNSKHGREEKNKRTLRTFRTLNLVSMRTCIANRGERFALNQGTHVVDQSMDTKSKTWRKIYI